MCFPSLIAWLFCFSALFLSSGYLFIYLFAAFFHNGSFQETLKDFAQIWLRLGSDQPSPYRAPSRCTSPGSSCCELLCYIGSFHN